MKFLSLRENTKGFTLIELIIAVSIVAVLASVVIVNLQDGKKKARDAQRINDIEQLQLALRLYKDAYNEYPTGFDSGVVIGEDATFDNLIEPFLSAKIVDSKGVGTGDPDQEYAYVYDSQHPCSGGGGNDNIVLFARTMETTTYHNQWKGKSGECGTGAGVTDESYGIILQ